MCKLCKRKRQKLSKLWHIQTAFEEIVITAMFKKDAREWAEDYKDTTDCIGSASPKLRDSCPTLILTAWA